MKWFLKLDQEKMAHEIHRRNSPLPDCTHQFWSSWALNLIAWISRPLLPSFLCLSCLLTKQVFSFQKLPIFLRWQHALEEIKVHWQIVLDLSVCTLLTKFRKVQQTYLMLLLFEQMVIILFGFVLQRLSLYLALLVFSSRGGHTQYLQYVKSSLYCTHVVGLKLFKSSLKLK